MTTVPQIARRRSYKRHLERKNPSGITALGCSLLVSLFLLLGGVAVSFFYVTLTRGLPSLQLFPLYLEPPNGLLQKPSILYDRTGEKVLLTLRNPAAAEARYLLVNHSGNGGTEFFSDVLINATLASIEPGYWSATRAPLVGLLNKGENILAQQLVSEIILWDQPEGMMRDLRVSFLAAQVIEEYGREKVLEWYLNSAKYGDYVYGADAASLVYLGKSASELNLAEGALIASIAEAPDINPHTVPDLALERQKELIQRMLVGGMISEDEANNASEVIFHFKESVNLQDDFRPFTSFILDQMASIMPRDRLERGGIQIITTMDYDLQIQAQCAIQAYVTQPGSQPGDLSAIDGSSCEAARLLPTIISSEDEFPERLSATAAITDPGTGQLLAFVMLSEDEDDPTKTFSFPPGTVLTPYIYLTAFARGFNPGTMVWDIPGGSENESLTSEPYHGPIRLRTALANDYLRPVMMLIDQIGSENIVTTLSRFELLSRNTHNAQADLEQLLFEEDTGFVDVIRAYGILANEGVIAGQVVTGENPTNDQPTIELSGILRLKDTSGNLLLDWSSPQSRSIVSSQLAYLISQILSDETARWESLGHPNPLEVGRTAAVKLSRSLDESGSWVIGYNPERLVGVWIESLQDGEQSMLHRLNAGLWHAIIQYALQGKPVVTWQVPPGIVSVEVCDPSGLLPTSNCPYIVTETFLSGQEPTHTDTLYRSFQINRETGNLATVFTPPELIEERVYLVVPQQAEDWARSEGLQLPPENYDAVGLPSTTSLTVRIDSPEMFSHIRGRVPVRGSAGGEEFSYYRIQVGQGLNPRVWIQIGEDYTEPVEDNTLVTWDTSGLSGLYTLRLMVVRQDQRVETAIHQVTIDNQAPELNILSPESGQKLSAGENDILVLRAEAVDDLKVEKVVFYLDDRLLATLLFPPYVVTWDSKIGEHKLVVEAVDLAGNTNQDSIEFTVIR